MGDRQHDFGAFNLPCAGALTYHRRYLVRTGVHAKVGSGADIPLNALSSRDDNVGVHHSEAQES